MAELTRYDMALQATISELDYLGVLAFPLKTRDAEEQTRALEFHMTASMREDDFDAFMDMLEMWEKLFKENQV